MRQRHDLFSSQFSGVLERGAHVRHGHVVVMGDRLGRFPCAEVVQDHGYEDPCTPNARFAVAHGMIDDDPITPVQSSLPSDNSREQERGVLTETGGPFLLLRSLEVRIVRKPRPTHDSGVPRRRLTGHDVQLNLPDAARLDDGDAVKGASSKGVFKPKLPKGIERLRALAEDRRLAVARIGKKRRRLGDVRLVLTGRRQKPREVLCVTDDVSEAGREDCHCP